LHRTAQSAVKLWDVESGSGMAEAGSGVAGDLTRLTTGAWDPHHSRELATADAGNVKGWDLRTMKTTHTIDGAHAHHIRDIDYNPNRTYVVVTSGDDCKIRFWDLRKGGAAGPLKTLTGHTHWVWSSKFNRFHDQLVLSSGSDNVVNLWRVSSISSAPLLEMDGESGDSKATEDTLVGPMNMYSNNTVYYC
jgi:WD40 repeat protein